MLIISILSYLKEKRKHDISLYHHFRGEMSYYWSGECRLLWRGARCGPERTEAIFAK